MIVVPTGGLCNYLRVVFSHYLEAQGKGEELIVVWRHTSACPGFFLDYFEGVNGITFLKNHDYLIENNLKVYYTGYSNSKKHSPDYSKLKPLPEIRSIIQEKKEILKNYIAIHVRRTDHVGLAKKNKVYTEDEHFFNFIESNVENKNLYVATDNLSTYNTFKDKYEKFIKFNYHKTVKSLRQTALKDAIVDLYMCVYADNFMGSGWSSFSDLIKVLRKYKNALPGYLED